MIEQVFATSSAIKDDRTIYQILAYLMEEVGELSTEINIQQGYSYKSVGKDGIVGEAVDCMVCLLDIIHQVNPTITPDMLSSMASIKLAKWRASI
jgi:NTP pyrophosphatase (non-canonical NTP hydrolase)